MKRTESAGILLYEKDPLFPAESAKYACTGKGILVVEHNELAKLPTGSYGFPAGRVEEGETPIQTAIRELEEETGLITRDENLETIPPVESTVRMKEGFEDFLFHPFLCRHYEGELRPGDKTRPEFIPLERLMQLPLVADTMIELIRKYMPNFMH